MKMKVLCYSPYWVWYIHGLFEATAMLALQHDGAQVDSLLCDGLYPTCDMETPAQVRTAASCNVCQAKQTSHIGMFPLRYRWIGRFLSLQDEREITEWGWALADHELETATFEGAPVNQWIRTSVHRTYRVNVLDLNDVTLKTAFRKYLIAAAMAYRAISRALDHYQPDLFVVFNGHRSTTRVALEVARARGIRVIAHERGLRRNSFLLFEGENCTSPNAYRQIWEAWGHVPLLAPEIAEATTYIRDRMTGKSLSWVPYSPLPVDASEVYAKLNITPDKPVWSLYTSSTDEWVGMPDYNQVAVMQQAWVLDTIEFLRAHPEVQLVIRTHPNSSSQVINRGEMEFIETIAQTLPSNVRLVRPKEEISTYDIIDASDLGIVFNSTTAIEMACRGIEVIFTGNGRYRDLPFLDTASTRGAYRLKYEEALQKPRRLRSWNRQRFAYRFVHSWIFRWAFDFPLLDMPSYDVAKPRYSSVQDLAPGRDAALDRIRRIVYDREPIIPRPTQEHLNRDERDEIMVFRDGTLAMPASAD